MRIPKYGTTNAYTNRLSFAMRVSPIAHPKPSAPTPSPRNASCAWQLGRVRPQAGLFHNTTPRSDPMVSQLMRHAGTANSQSPSSTVRSDDDDEAISLRAQQHDVRDLQRSSPLYHRRGGARL